ncbi:hypothetical protein NPIL_535611 [Nephila pilipes]|uniref:Uncharacterized protein n=1 Tax=Nephila pilipes TaxID=299642 RepID=A0A8X6TY84_NEPPI|nr:hypothetical protein NPIL_535611 [Nephila pilipes]
MIKIIAQAHIADLVEDITVMGCYVFSAFNIEANVFQKNTSSHMVGVEKPTTKRETPKCNRKTSCVGVVSLRNISVERIAKTFYSNWISRFGASFRLITYQGTQFVSDTFAILPRLCEVKLQKTTIYIIFKVTEEQKACNELTPYRSPQHRILD